MAHLLPPSKGHPRTPSAHWRWLRALLPEPTTLIDIELSAVLCGGWSDCAVAAKEHTPLTAIQRLSTAFCELGWGVGVLGGGSVSFLNSIAEPPLLKGLVNAWWMEMGWWWVKMGWFVG